MASTGHLLVFISYQGCLANHTMIDMYNDYLIISDQMAATLVSYARAVTSVGIRVCSKSCPKCSIVTRLEIRRCEMHAFRCFVAASRRALIAAAANSWHAHEACAEQLSDFL